MNVIYICDELDKVIHSNVDLKEKLNEAAKVVYNDTEAKIMFCELFGPRWSFIGGWADEVIPQERIKLNEKYGIIVENFDISSEERISLIEKLEKLFI